jgi:hypothetical protein
MNARLWVLAVPVLMFLVSCAPRAACAEEVPVAADSLRDMKSGSTAFLSSLVGTTVPVALGIATASHDEGSGAGAALIGGYLLGPSLGHFYAGRPGRAFKGIGIRTAILAGVGALVSATWDRPGNDGLAALGIAGLGVGVIDGLVDIADASRSARIHNEEVRQSRLRLTPATVGMAPGVRVDVAF